MKQSKIKAYGGIVTILDILLWKYSMQLCPVLFFTNLYYNIFVVVTKRSNLFFVIHTLNFAQVISMDYNRGEWVECMNVASWCGEQEAGVASGRGWNLRVWL